ncbi:MAG: LacI family transcriptional regulator [Clostridia bacterium]|nr:LacI family transcriptional regulator [Clostridia bacterium]
MPVTIKDVAARCKMSVSTISKAFNGYGDISAETKEMIHRIADEMGYYPNASARALKTNRSYNLGVVFTEEMRNGLTHNFFAAVLNAFKFEAEKSGYDVTFINHNIGGSGMSFLEHCRYRNVDGVCVTCANFYSSEVVKLISGELPCVTVDHVFSGRNSVISDNVSGMSKLVHYAYSLGHRRLAYIHGQQCAVTENRLLGFHRAAAELNLQTSERYIMASVYDNPEAGYEAVLKMMDQPEPPTCIFMPDDQSAIGALKALNEHGISCPGDVSLAGYDGTKFAGLVTPRLTTVRQDTDTMGRKAAELLIREVEDRSFRAGLPEIVPVTLVEGESIAKI